MDHKVIDGINNSLASLEDRIARIENKLDIKVSQPSNSTLFDSPSFESPIKPSSHSPSGGKMLGGLAVLFFILAAAFFVKLAVDSGWLTPLRQLAGLYLFGGILIGTAFHLKERDLKRQ